MAETVQFTLHRKKYEFQQEGRYEPNEMFLVLLAALLSLEDPRVDKVLKEFRVNLNVNSERIWPPSDDSEHTLSLWGELSDGEK